jgi:Cu(I)/Ag(I) efflux system membrane protein CusA/SilA
VWVTVVPLLCRLFLRNTKVPSWAGAAVGVGFGSMTAALCFFVWGDFVQHWLHLGRPWATAICGIVGFLVGWWMTRERTRPIEENPVSRFVRLLYAGRLRMALKHKLAMLSIPAIIIVLGIGAWKGLPWVLSPVERLFVALGADLNDVPGYIDAKHTFTGLKQDDWIALDEGSWFYMPSLYPAASFNQAMEVLQTQDAMIKQIPEVENVLGKIGRVESALDPAPAAMIETYIMLKPREQWRAGMTGQKIWDEINRVATLPGITPASPLQPIEGRVVMLQSGIKASMAVRIQGDDLDGLSEASLAVAEHLKQHHYVNAGTVNPDIVLGKPYFEFDVNREEAARYGMTTMMVNQVVAAGLGGVDVTTTVEGRERYPIQIRYRRDLREKMDELGGVPVVTSTGEVVPLRRLADVTTTWGPGAMNSEDARLVAHVSFSPQKGAGDLETVEAVETSLRSARKNGTLKFPEGNFDWKMVGSFENQIKTNQRLWWLGPLLDIDDPKRIASNDDVVPYVVNRIPLGLVPLAVLINLMLIYLAFRNFPISLIVFLGIPVSFAGGMMAVAVMGVDMNTAVWVGFIALFGIAVDDGVVMATYIQQVLRRRRIETVDQLREAIYEAGLKRIRPCVMTTVTTLVALLPVMLSTGRGADVARAMALPAFGGMLVEPFTSFIVPTLYCAYMEMKVRVGLQDRLLSASEADSSPPQQAVATSAA